ncbi:N-acyl-D-amino-acid deacylase family protein [Pacificimonas sp. ICDLI1SI03]
MTTSILIKNGTVVDGTGGPARKADVRIERDRIAAIEPSLDARDGEEVFDAKGCHVTPGFIETHTHYDASMWWQPELDPQPGNGATTVILGNCGFTAAPLSKEKAAQMEMIKIFSFFEDIPMGPFLEHVPWDWEKWSEYKNAMTTKVKIPLNYSAYVGHIALRLAAMGVEAWERAATAQEIERMAELLEDALDAGALGLSDNLHDHDGDDRPIPTLKAEDEEFEALFDVMARYPQTTYQVIVDTFMRMTAPDQMTRLERLTRGRGIRIQIAGAVPTLGFQKPILAKCQETLNSMREAGADVWPGFAHVSPTSTLSLTKSLIFAQSNDYVWHEVVLADSDDEKRALLADEDWRARARNSWDTKAWDHSPLKNPDELFLLDSENGKGPVGGTLKEYADQRGQHRSDAMADWILENGVKSTVHMAPFPKDEELTVELMKSEQALGNVSDAGAHLQMLCGGGENILTFTKYVAEGHLTMEEAVHYLTGKPARFFNLQETGTLEVGKRADIAVFDLDEIEYQTIEKAWDMPDGKGGTTWRFTRPAAPMRLTLVNGVATFRDGKQTDARPGEYLVPALANENERILEAAE